MLIIVLCAACGGATTSPLAPTLILAPTVASAYQGTWAGQTANQLDRVGFVVVGNQVTRLEFSVSYSDVSCSGGMSFGTFGPLASISNAGFSATYASSTGDLTWSIAGSFVSATTATGTLQVTNKRSNATGPVSTCVPTVQVSWTAQKSS